ncbi:MAG: DNA polymerase IV [Spirochaetales bacterium]|nr:DNA polymerase IV [Spirochaetales bacterium]
MAVIAHIDLDAFFAAVEQEDNPQLKGSPVIVGGDRESRRGVVCAASYEARAYGVRSAMPVGQALRLCPTGIFLRPRFSRYVSVSRTVMEIFRGAATAVEPLSLDEAFLDLSSVAADPESARKLVAEIKGRIKEDTGLTASAGVATSKAVAKVASDLEKPNGLVVCPAGREREFLAPLSVEKLWGAGKKTCGRLAREGIRTVGELAALPRWQIREWLGNAGGERLWHLAQGLDQSQVNGSRKRKSLGVERTLVRDTGDLALIQAMLARMAVQLEATLKNRKLSCEQVALKVRFQDFTTTNRSRKLSEATDDAQNIYEVALQLLHKHCLRESQLLAKVRLIGISVADFIPAKGRQLVLFT